MADTAVSPPWGNTLPPVHRSEALKWGGAGWGEELLRELDAEWEVQLCLESELVALSHWNQLELVGHMAGRGGGEGEGEGEGGGRGGEGEGEGRGRGGGRGKGRGGGEGKQRGGGRGRVEFKYIPFAES